jgi:putative MATE family efflux protein
VVGYVLWLVAMITGAIGVGSTAIIARAVGARHRRLANRVCGQSIGAVVMAGVVLAGLCYAGAPWFASRSGLSGQAQEFTFYYFRVLSLSLPFSMVMMAGGACLRGAGDTLTPAASMIVVDVVNVVVSFALTRGWWGLPEMGFKGIAIGTVLAYVVGGVLLVGVLLRGSHSLRLYPHRLHPHWLTLKRILRIGLPSGAGETLAWFAQFAIVLIINRIDATNVAAAAHILTVRVESLSYLAGYAVSIAAATMVGQSLGMGDPRRASRSAWLAFALGGAWCSSSSAGRWPPSSTATRRPWT